jgi:hypothetical protein
MKPLPTSARLMFGPLALLVLSVECLTRKRAKGRDSFPHFAVAVREHPKQSDRGKQ